MAPAAPAPRTRQCATSVHPLARWLAQESLGEQTVLDADVVVRLDVSDLGAVAALQVLHAALDRGGVPLHVGNFVSAKLFEARALLVVLLLLERQVVQLVPPGQAQHEE